MFFVILLNGLWVLIKGIHFVFLLEKKNYRLNRFQAMIHDRGFFVLFYSLQIKIPTKSLRNMLILGFHLVTTIAIFLYAFENLYLYDFLTYFFWLAPFIAFMIVVTGVKLTQIPAWVYQWSIMQLAAFQVRKSNAMFIAVTGSYGKSDVVYFLKELLSEKYIVASTMENMNTEMGIARSILNNLTKDTDFFIVEAATYGPGQIHRSTGYIPFESAILTGIGNQHRDLFRSHKALIREEASIISHIGAGKKVYVNSDSLSVENVSKIITRDCITYGFSRNSDIYSTNHHITHTGTSARIQLETSYVTIRSRLLGKSALHNMMPAVAVALENGIHPAVIARKIEQMKQRFGRLSLHRSTKRTIVMYDDADVSVESVLNACDVLRRFPYKKKIIVTQGLTELGVEKSASYKRILDEVASVHATLFIMDHMGEKPKKGTSVNTFNDVSTLQNDLLLSVDKGTVIVILGIFPSSFIESVIT